MNRVEEANIGAVIDAHGRQDWNALKARLHPYLHWTRRDGKTIRGRTRVLAHLSRVARLTRPADYELRDAQIYRWTEA